MWGHREGHHMSHRVGHQLIMWAIMWGSSVRQAACIHSVAYVTPRLIMFNVHLPLVINS